jgi:hypothetical protein
MVFKTQDCMQLRFLRWVEIKICADLKGELRFLNLGFLAWVVLQIFLKLCGVG